MKVYNGELKKGMKILYNGEIIEWVNPKTGKVNEKMKKGEYIISKITSRIIYVVSSRKNAVTEHKIYRDEIEGKIKEIEFADITTTIGLVAININNPIWVLADDNFKKIIKDAKKYNRSR